MIVHYFLPKVSFTGRLSVAGFWREIILSLIWTPVVVGAIAYLLHASAQLASDAAGLSASNLKTGAAVTLFVIGSRNMVAHLGAIVRRLHDLGHTSRHFFKALRPSIVMIAFLPVVAVFPLLGPLCIFAVYWQIANLFRLAKVLLFEPGQYADTDQADAVPTAWHMPDLKQPLNMVTASVSKGLAQAAANASPRPQKAKLFVPTKGRATPRHTIARPSIGRPRSGKTNIFSGVVLGPWG